MVNKILIPAILNGYRPLRDRSWSISLNLNEPNKEQKEIIDQMHQKAVFVLIKDAQVTKDEEELIDSVDADIETKTPSQRLRGVLYRNFEQENKGCKDFKEYYRIEMERIINHYKQKLD
jgi:hypothetical protein